MLNRTRLEKIDQLVRKLYKETDKWMALAIAVDLADEIMKGILPDKPEFTDQLNRNVQETGNLPRPLPGDTFRTQKQSSWFHEHPESASARVALRHFYDKNFALESNFFWLSDSATKQKISASTEFNPNWEDSELTRKPDFKVSIDFFLTHDTKALLLVITNRHKLRVLELKEKLSNTQKLLFEQNLNGAASFDGIVDGVRQDFEPQRTIHAALWNALQIKEVNKRFYLGVARLFEELVERLMQSGKDHENAKQFSSRLLGRLLFTWFLRKMNLINEAPGYFEIDGMTSAEYYNQKLRLLFFETFNTPIENRKHSDLLTPFLNGGLFEFKQNDYRFETLPFPEDYFNRMYNHFDEFNFTTDESSSDFELIAVDPEMLGQVFEELLASQLNEEGTNERNQTGSFYTPREIVDYMCKETLRQYLYNKVNNEQFNAGIDLLIDLPDSQFLTRKSTSQAELWGVNSKEVSSKIITHLNEFKVLDPACGSGAYPMGMLQVLLKTYERLENRFDPYKLKLSIIEKNIYGVDIQPMAVEISRLRAWLSVIVDEQEKTSVRPLPNLEFKFVCANTLVDLADSHEILADHGLQDKLGDLRDRYFRARKPETKKQIQDQYLSITSQMSIDERSNQLRSFDPFNNRSSSAYFDSEYMLGVNGFDAVIGNPPYIHFEKMEIENRDFYKNLKYKTYAARGDIYTLFYERGIELLRENGVLTFITSNKWLRAQYGSALRNYLIKYTNPLQLIDLGSGVFDSATVDTNILIVEKGKNNDELYAVNFKVKREENMSDFFRQNKNPLIPEVNESWIILNQIEQSIKKKIARLGILLSKWEIRVNYGIKTGCNEAFIISNEERENLVEKEPSSAEIIRPILRGRDISKNAVDSSGQYLIVTHNGYRNEEGVFIEPVNITNYPAVKRHLDKSWDKILKRLDQGITPYNLRSCAYMEEFYKPKIVYREISTAFNACLVEPGVFVNNKCYFITGENLPYLTAFLNSKLFSKIVIPQANTTGGKGPSFISTIQIPKPDGERSEEIIKLQTILIGADKRDRLTIASELDNKICESYQLTEEETRYIME